MNNQADDLRTVPDRETQPTVPAAEPRPADCPAYVGRYRVERLLGEGGFGRVYLAHDDQLQRPVAVKVPHARLVARPEEAGVYLAEARTAARLDHPHIVPVFDLGSTPDCPCYIVSKYVEGRTLAWRLHNDRPGPGEAAALVATVADALHHAHHKGVVHRDVKPGNILLDAAGLPYVADFGLALREGDLGRGSGYAGTPAYMSPEQARGEGHRVDGRSDIYSLGVILYELLTGRRPFRAESRPELLELIATADPRPPRQLDDTIPRELERICLKALARRAAERYTTASDLAEDLRHFLTQYPDPEKTAVRAGAPGPEPLTPTAPATPTPSLPGRIVPKGLRSFDAADADFFLELLPGPRDRDGLPDSLRFWKARVEETDPDNTFPVGLIYGPSGCGKSSLVKAGLLPRLAGHVLPVYVEAAGDQTEARLLAGLRKHCPGVPAGPLKETLAALRRGQGLPPGKKVLVVLDQFEQFLHARQEEDAELVQALRQCDGGRVQCLVLVRDDFWMAATRFMRALEIRLVEGDNSAAADLFPVAHAEKVLAAFGRAFGALPDRSGEIGREQRQFLTQAVRGLAQDGKVVCVRLALFAEMMKGRPWTPAALRAVGGAEGVGATFLEETFSAAGAPPEHRYHQKAAQAVLRALLPGSGTDIKGHMRSDAELLAASGYADRPRDFDELLRILDSEVRLITPTDPEGTPGEAIPARRASEGIPARRASEGSSDPSLALRAGMGARYYQLTHDYLVPSLREWLTRKQKETYRGRAELRLAERAALWNSKPVNQYLPAWWEWLALRLLTRPAAWTAPQRRMMRRAARYYTARGVLLAVGLVVLLALGREAFCRQRAQALHDRLLVATTEEVPGIVRAMAPYRPWLDPGLRQAYAWAEANGDARKQLNASLALLPDDPGQAEYLYGRLLTAAPHEATVLREALRPHADALVGRLWAVLEDRQADPGRRLRAACALADYAPDDPRWEGVRDDVAARLVAENALVLGQWADALRPVRRFLLPALAGLLLGEGHDPTERRTTTRLYGDYAEGLPDAFALLEQVLAEEKGPADDAAARLARARRQANAAVALAAVGRWDRVRPLLRHRPDPTVRSYLIDRLADGGVDPQALTELLAPDTEPSVRRAALLALGEFDRDRLPPAGREALVPRLLVLYRDDPDPGVHGAAGWLLRRWGGEGKVPDLERSVAPQGGRGWYVNGLGQTFGVVPPGEFWMREGARRERRRIDRGFALADRPVTVAEFQRFRPGFPYSKEFAPDDACPMNGVSWYDAAAYCNWLSKKEGLPEDQWCYLPNAEGKYADGMRLAPNFRERTGYRLPTEAEYEYACRAGSTTRWAFGDAEELLVKYAWHVVNAAGRSHPVKGLRPNDLGLFDVHGNIWEWCHDPQKPAAQESDTITDKQGPRQQCGGSFANLPIYVRSASRQPTIPSDGSGLNGFRPARTLP